MAHHRNGRANPIGAAHYDRRYLNGVKNLNDVKISLAFQVNAGI
jgi:hypothetical protein